VCVSWLIHTEVRAGHWKDRLWWTYSFVCVCTYLRMGSFVGVSHDSLYVWDMTHSYAHSFVCVSWLMYTQVGATQSWRHTWMIYLLEYDSLYGETWLIVWWDMTHSYVHLFVCVSWWLRLVGSIQLYVSFAKEPYKRDAILQKHLFVCVSWCHS